MQQRPGHSAFCLSNVRKYIILFVILAGIVLRFHTHFIEPTYNEDEIALGTNIKNRDILSLLGPLNEWQTAPPLYLITQKAFFSLVEPFWVSSKLFSFLVSIAILLTAYRFMSSFFATWASKFLFILFFSFSPFIIYNTLTIKQYGVDLLFVMIAILNYDRYRLSARVIPYFIIWSLFSNIGMFHIAGFLAYEFIRHLSERRPLLSFFTMNRGLNIKVILTPLPYILYFIWYLQQDGASEIREFQTNYWKANFMPLDAGFFEYISKLVFGISFFLISSHLWIAIPAFIVFVIGLFCFLAHGRSKGRHAILFGVFGIVVHLAMSALKTYPMAERLYLYLTPVFFFLLLYVIDMVALNRIFRAFTVALLSMALIGYFQYIPFRENDIVSVYRWMQARTSGENVYFARRAYNEIDKFNTFTDSAFVGRLSFAAYDSSARQGLVYLVSRASLKYGHEKKTSPEEGFTRTLLEREDWVKVDSINGYNIYLQKNQMQP